MRGEYACSIFMHIQVRFRGHSTLDYPAGAVLGFSLPLNLILSSFTVVLLAYFKEQFRLFSVEFKQIAPNYLFKALFLNQSPGRELANCGGWLGVLL